MKEPPEQVQLQFALEPSSHGGVADAVAARKREQIAKSVVVANFFISSLSRLVSAVIGSCADVVVSRQRVSCRRAS